MNKAISVVISTGDTVSDISNCVNSILKQSYRNIEVIIVGYVLTKETQEILERYAESDDRIVLYTNPCCGGKVGGWNYGIEKAKGDYILLVDSDDFLTEGTLEVLERRMGRCADIYIFNGILFDNDDKSVIKTGCISLKGDFFENGRIKEEHLFDLCSNYSPYMKLYSLNFLVQHDIRFSEFMYQENAAFWMKCLAHSCNVDYISYYGYMQRVRKEMSVELESPHKNMDSMLDELEKLLESMKGNRDLHRFMADVYFQNLCKDCVCADRQIYRHLFDQFIRLSEQYDLGMSRELVSVVIPVYNGGLQLAGTLGSVLDQTHINMEILIVDDGSEEDIESCVNTIGDYRLVYTRLPHRNADVARNYGISRAKGAFVAMLDADDLWTPDHLSDCIRTLKISGADGLYGSLTIRQALGTETDFYVTVPRMGESMANYLLRTGYGAQTSTLFMTAQSAKDVLWNEALNRHQDYDFVVRYSRRYRLGIKSKVTVIHCLSTKPSEIDFWSCIQFIEANKTDIEPLQYHLYSRNMLQSAINLHAVPEVIEYYSREATLYKEYLSFVQFLSFRKPSDKKDIEILRQEYIGYISAIEVEFR